MIKTTLRKDLTVSYNVAIALLGIYPREVKTCLCKLVQEHL